MGVGKVGASRVKDNDRYSMRDGELKDGTQICGLGQGVSGSGECMWRGREAHHSHLIHPEGPGREWIRVWMRKERSY